MNKIIKSCLLLALIVSVQIGSNLAFAHGSDEPMHGGVVKTVGDMTFELVKGNNSVDLFVVDEGEEINTEGMAAKIKINLNGEKSEYQLKPSGGNKFSATGVAIPAGAKVLVLVTLSDTYSKIGARFVF